MKFHYKWQQWLSLGLPFPLIFLNSWLGIKLFQYFQPLVSIFILAGLLAFILNYPVRFFQQRGVNRTLAIVLVVLLALIILSAFGITLVPILIEEFNEIAKRLPAGIASSKQQLEIINNWADRHNLPINLSQLIAQIAQRIPTEAQSLSQQIVGLVLEAIDSISDIALVIVLTFYLLLDGARLWNAIFQKLPISFAPQVQQALQESFQNYFIGQFSVATTLGIAMTCVFLILKVPFGLLFGVIIGFLSLIPFGDIVGFTLAIVFTLSQDFWLGVRTLVVIILVDQVIDQLVTPRLLGTFTGLRPIWVLIALLIGAKIGGLLGLIIAVPVAGFIKTTIDSFQVTIDSSGVSVEDLTATTEQAE